MVNRSGNQRVLVGCLLTAAIVNFCNALSLSMRSSFLGQSHGYISSGMTKSNFVMYDTSRDPQPSSPEFNAWTVLANTERWISTTLAESNANTGKGGVGPNPYTRKEVSYECETHSAGALIVAGIFRRLKEARMLGEAHGRRQQKLPAGKQRQTLRLTRVLVIPSHPQFQKSFVLFNALMETINQARRHARDYVLAEPQQQPEQEKWSVSVNCAHLHPNFGEKTPEQLLQEMKQEEEQGEVDLNYQEYLRKKTQARQSPYPSVVIEIRATPPPDFGAAPAVKPKTEDSAEKETEITAADIARLEALFSKSAHTKHPSKSSSAQQDEDAFYAALAASMDQVLPRTPLTMAQEWIAQNDPNVNPLAAFTESDTPFVDEAYEYAFTNIAMLLEQNQHRQYLVMPHFLPLAATSFEKFSKQVKAIAECLPENQSRLLSVSTFHPEHVDPTRRSPFSILALHWIDNVEL